jgi:hypothetical protein
MTGCCGATLRALRGAVFPSSPRTPFSFGRHVEIIAAKLTAVLDGATRRLIINKPSLIIFIIFSTHRCASGLEPSVGRNRVE